MKEELLHYIWKFQKFNQKQLYTTEGESIIVIHPGNHNHHSGPDFKEAKIKIGSTEWFGNVEIHVKSSDWFQHQHQKDSNYQNVILHVVWEHDLDEFHRPTLTLSEKVSKLLINRYESLMQKESFISCEDHLPVLNDFEWNQWIERLLIERIEHKTTRIKQGLAENQNNWTETFYQHLAYNFGLSTNQDAMMELTKRIPLKILEKHKQQRIQIEALLFGTSGLLPEDQDEYTSQLKSEFIFLQKKYGIQSMRKENWNFGRIRPASFPTIRIAQLAALIQQSYHLFSQIIQPISIKEIQQYFDVSVSDYWHTHFTFEKQSQSKVKPIGKSKKDNIIINTIAPFQFCYGREMNQPKLVTNALALLEQSKKEKNKITSFFENQYIVHDSAYQSQALIHLYKQYCKPKQCLKCRVANTFLQKND